MEEEQDIQSDIVKQKQLRDAQENQEFDRDMDAYRRGRNLTDEQRKQVLQDNARKRQLLGSQLLDNIGGKFAEAGSAVMEAAQEDPDTWTDDLIRIGLGGVRNVGTVLGAPGIKQGLQLLGAPAYYVGRGLGYGLEKAGVDPRYGHIAGEVGEWFIPGYGMYKAAGKIVKTGKALNTLSKMGPIERGLAVGTVGAAKPIYKRRHLLKHAILGQIDQSTDKAVTVTRALAEPVNKSLVESLRKAHGGTKEQAEAFLKVQQQAQRDVRRLIDVLNIKAMSFEPKDIQQFTDAVSVALGKDINPLDFIGDGKSITYTSAKGKQVIKDLDDLQATLFDRLSVVGGTRAKGHFSLGHIRAVQNLIEQGDVGANRLSNMEPEVLRSILQVTNANPNQIEEAVAVLGNSARQNLYDKPDQILLAQNVSRTINEEYLKFIEPKVFGDYWEKVLPIEHYDTFEDAVDASVSEKIKYARNLKKVKTVEEGEKIIRGYYQNAMDDYLDTVGSFGKALEEMREIGIDKAIMDRAPEIIVDHLEQIEGKVVWVPPKPGNKDWKTMKRILEENNLTIDDVETALRAGWDIKPKKPTKNIKNTINASELTIEEIEARVNAGWDVDFNK